jgi:pyruvate/2-oxoglutarate dehydrogenase complex dihydrolipoamide acyltransferase (E2) component
MLTIVQVPRYVALLKNYASKPRITRWFADDGGTIEAGQTLLTIETSKTSLEIEASVSGQVFILRPINARVKIGDILALIADNWSQVAAFKDLLLAYEMKSTDPQGD